jgi:hypothetical protein
MGLRNRPSGPKRKKPQVPPLRFAPVGMTILLARKRFSEKYLTLQ